MNKLLFAAFIVGGALASACPSNPFFYVSGMVPTLDQPATPATSHPLCPTTFASGTPSCCTAAYLDQAQALLDRRTMAYSAAGELVKLVSGYIPQIKPLVDAIHQSGKAQCGALTPGETDHDVIVENAADAIGQDLALSAASKAINSFSTYQTTINDAFKALLGKYAKLQHGAVCASCLPDVHLSVATNEFTEIDEIIDSFAVTLKKSTEIKDIITEDVFNAIDAISTAFNSMIPEDLTQSPLVDHYMGICTAGISDDTEKALIRESVLTKLSKTSIIVIPTASEVLEELTEHDLGGVFSVGVQFAEIILQSSYGASAADIERGVSEMRAFFKRCVSNPLSPYCGNPENMPKLFTEISGSEVSFIENARVVAYRKQHLDYTIQEINAGIQDLDLYRLLGLDNDSEFDLIPKVNYVESSDPKFESSPQPLELAASSEIKYEDRVLETINKSAANGFSLMAAIFVLLVTVFA